jgi:hypothetical protein
MPSTLTVSFLAVRFVFTPPPQKKTRLPHQQQGSKKRFSNFLKLEGMQAADQIKPSPAMLPGRGSNNGI